MSAMRRDPAYWALLVITTFQAATAIAGGIALIATDGLGMPLSMLENAPFDSFLWPGLILVVVVGGTQTTAALTLLRRTGSALFWSAIAGLGMLIWIFVETALIRDASWLQIVYFATGAAQLALVLVMEGVARELPHATVRHRRSTWREHR
ncbi:MAG TPA: hypothetical protein VN107_01030 [Microbacterium sp.]|nr:hypothetical protein [Microbacterium sp.]